MKSASIIMLQIQRDQNAHDLLAHRDILNLDTHTKIKHMTLHFLKYAGKLVDICEEVNRSRLETVLVDIFIICLATANSLNVNLGENWHKCASNLNELSRNFCASADIADPFKFSLLTLVKIAGKMAKAIESTDHLERGNPRAELELLIVELTTGILAAIGCLETPLEEMVRTRWSKVESKSIFLIS